MAAEKRPGLYGVLVVIALGLKKLYEAARKVCGHRGYYYALVGGAPDQYVIESWIGAPSRCLPEIEAFTFTRSAHDFAQRFVKRPAQILPLK